MRRCTYCMITFMKSYHLDNIKRKFQFIYFFNVMDLIFTVLLLQTGYFTEMNILMVKVVKSSFASILIKIILPALLLYYVYRKMKYANESQLKDSNIAINFSLIIYLLVNLSHLVWSGLLIIHLF